MTGKGRRSLTQTLLDLVWVVPNVFSLCLKLASAVKIEARLAAQNTALLITLSFIFACILLTIWMSLLVLLVVYLISIPISLSLAILIVLLINLLLLLILGIMIYRVKRYFSVTELMERLGIKD